MIRTRARRAGGGSFVLTIGAGILMALIVSLGGCAGVPASSVSPAPVRDPGCIDQFSGYVSVDCR
jgi:hypothetical protein